MLVRVRLNAGDFTFRRHFFTLMLFVIDILSFLIIVVPVLISVAYLTLAERKIMGAIQMRTGPNVVGFLVCFNRWLMV